MDFCQYAGTLCSTPKASFRWNPFGVTAANHNRTDTPAAWASIPSSYGVSTVKFPWEIMSEGEVKCSRVQQSAPRSSRVHPLVDSCTGYTRVVTLRLDRVLLQDELTRQCQENICSMSCAFDWQGNQRQMLVGDNPPYAANVKILLSPVETEIFNRRITADLKRQIATSRTQLAEYRTMTANFQRQIAVLRQGASAMVTAATMMTGGDLFPAASVGIMAGGPASAAVLAGPISVAAATSGGRQHDEQSTGEEKPSSLAIPRFGVDAVAMAFTAVVAVMVVAALPMEPVRSGLEIDIERSTCISNRGAAYPFDPGISPTLYDSGDEKDAVESGISSANSTDNTAVATTTATATGFTWMEYPHTPSTAGSSTRGLRGSGGLSWSGSPF
ncbi:unnamed protein product [Pylaiella littoralis]